MSSCKPFITAAAAHYFFLKNERLPNYFSTKFNSPRFQGLLPNFFPYKIFSDYSK